MKCLRRDTSSSGSKTPLLTQTSADLTPAPAGIEKANKSSDDHKTSGSAIASEIIHHHKKGLLISLAAVVVVIVGMAYMIAKMMGPSTPATPNETAKDDPGISVGSGSNEDEDEARETPTPSPVVTDGVPRLAVLPFVIQGDAPDAAYLADEIPASIIDSMATLSGLTVVPRSSAFRHRDSAEDVTTIGLALGADYVLTGQITTRAGTMQVRAELVDVATDTQQWSERFDPSIDDTLEVETEITRRLVDALHLQITGEERAALARMRPVNPEAHAACLEGRFWWNKRTPEGLQKSIDLYEEAIRLDPEYGVAHAEIGKAYLMTGVYSQPPIEHMPLAYAALQRAIEIDPGLPEPHAGNPDRSLPGPGPCR